MTDPRTSSIARPPGQWTVVHDFAFVLAGAERVTQVLANYVLDGAPVRVIGGSDEVLAAMQLRSAVDRLLPSGLVRAGSYRALTAVYPWLLRNRAPIVGNVLCSSYAFAHHVRCTGAKVVLCHTPLRQIWSDREAYLAAAGPAERAYIELFQEPLRRADRAAAHSADAYIAVSQHVRDRLDSFYRLPRVSVIAPPVETDFLADDVVSAVNRHNFLWVGRITEPYKRLSVVIDAFRGSRHRLLIAGDGVDRARLEAAAPENVQFLGWRDQEQLRGLYRHARAIIFPSKDDFGLVPLEATASGTPTLAYRGGGAVETVVEGTTGLLFDRQDVASIREVIERCDQQRWDYAAIRRSASRFSRRDFVNEVRQVLVTVAAD